MKQWAELRWRVYEVSSILILWQTSTSFFAFLAMLRILQYCGFFIIILKDRLQAHSFSLRNSASKTSSSRLSSTMPQVSDEGERSDMITILGFGSLLSERSSRTTFPDLQGFRLGRVRNYRRVFGHPASIFFKRGIANLGTKEISSLSAEPCAGHPGFICSIFEVPSKDMMNDGIPSQAFLEREEEFNILTGVTYNLLENPECEGTGILCTSSTDEEYLRRWGEDHFQKQYKQYGVNTIWGWKNSSGLRPCAVYLRHCYLAAKSMGDECLDSFLDETYLVDRKSTVRDYIQDHPEVLDTQPPKELIERYSG